MAKIVFPLNLSGKKFLKFPHYVFPIRLPRSVLQKVNNFVAGIAGSTGTGYSLPGSTSTGFGGNSNKEASIYGTVTSDTNYGSVDTNYFSSNK